MSKRIQMMIATLFAVMGTSVIALASETGNANSAVVSALTTTAQDMTATGQAILPVALTVLGLMLVVRYGLKFFKSITK